jgi:LemA protein
MTIAIIVIVVLIVAAILYVVATFNGLIRLQQRADEGFSDIDVQLKRRHDLIPNLVETVKGYAAHERQTLENVTAARAAAVSATGPQAQAQAENQLTGALRQLFAVAENYPDLKASANFLALQEELTGTESKIAYARQYYNEQVRLLNTRIQSFPSSLIASTFHFTRRDFFDIEDAARGPVMVNLGEGGRQGDTRPTPEP